MSDQTPEERPRDLAGSFFDMEGNRDKAPSADCYSGGEVGRREDGGWEAGLCRMDSGAKEARTVA